jgi:periplasmic mercuric ion binding protein
MKTIFLSIILFLSVNLFGQDNTVKTFTLSVKGNCDQCKERIENAADIKGVKLCTWDEKTQVATITYKSDKVTPEQIEKAIAKAGHDAGSAKSSDATYKKLPGCCQYRDRACEDKK